MGGPRGRWVASGSSGFILARRGVVGFFRVGVGSLQQIRCCRVYSGSRRLTCAPRGVGFNRVRVGSLRRTRRWSGSSRFSWVHSGGLVVWSGSFGFTLVYSGTLSSHRVQSG